MRIEITKLTKAEQQQRGLTASGANPVPKMLYEER